MESVDTISFRLEDDRRHDKMVLTIGDRQWLCDSYYFETQAALASLLRQWHAALSALSEGDVCYLPFNFFDEGICWLRCEAAGEEFCVQPGWSEVVGGYGIWPSDIPDAYIRCVPDFRLDGESVLIPRKIFLHAISDDLS